MENNLKRCILVDADACPVKDEIASACKQFGMKAIFVASYDHQLPNWEGMETVYVDRSAQSADLYLSNRMKPGDLLITQDHGLAAVGLAKRCFVLSFRGKRYTHQSIDWLLEQRHVYAKHRRTGKYGKGPKPFTASDRNKFLQSLTKLLNELQENEEI